MLFTINEFEQYCGEKDLKKGLHLFLKKKITPLVSQRSSEFVYLVDSVELSLKLNGKKLLWYSCHCGSTNTCSHLCAVLFYLQPEIFESKISVKTKSNKELKRVSTTEKENALLEKRKKIEISYLKKFIQAQSKQLNFQDIEPILQEKSCLNSDDIFDLLLEHLLENSFNEEKLGAFHVNDLIKRLNTFIDKNKRNNLVDCQLYLSVFGIFLKLFLKRYSGDESKLYELYENVCEKLHQYFEDGLTPNQEKTWYKYVLNTIESNKIIETGLFYFLLSRWISRTKSNAKLSHVQHILAKRHVKTHHSERIQKIGIIKQMLHIREQKLAKIGLKLAGETNEVEFMLANCELHFFANMPNRAFKILDLKYEEIKKEHTEYYQEVLNYILEKAEKWKQVDLEIKYLKESFIHGLFILPEKLKQYLQLFPKDQRALEVENVIRILKKNPINYSFDKVSVLLWEAKRWDDLITEIKRQKTKLPLLHSVLFKKLPNYSIADVSLYRKQLTASILEKEFYPYQLQLVNNALSYLDKLPEGELKPFMENLLNGLLKQSQIYRYIKQEFDLD